MRTLAIANQKGGIGKTTSAINIADAIRHKGHTVLFLDLDPQCNSTGTFKAQIDGVATMADVFSGDVEPTDAIQTTEMGDIIPGDPLLANDEAKYQSTMAGFNKVKNICKKVGANYEFCIIDTPPNLGIYMINALNAANGVIIPIQADNYAIEGLTGVIKTIKDVQENGNDNLKIEGVLLTKYDARMNLDKETRAQLPAICNSIGLPLFDIAIRTDQTIKDAQAAKVSLFDVAPKCKGAMDYDTLVDMLINEQN